MHKKIINKLAGTKTQATDSEHCWKMNNILVDIKFLFLILPLQVDNMEESQKNSDIQEDKAQI
jgi:hypothetical protein